MTIALVCSALLGVLVFGLGFAVSMTRIHTSRGTGCDEDPTDALHKVVRAHGNTAEYAAMLAVLFLLVGSRDPARWALGSMIGATVSRYLLAIGLLAPASMARPHPVRFLGAAGTYLFGLALCVALLMSL
jgi:uncharacterized protein